MDTYCYVCNNTGWIEEDCECCHGTGVDPDYPDDACPECYGTGAVEYTCDRCNRVN